MKLAADYTEPTIPDPTDPDPTDPTPTDPAPTDPVKPNVPIGGIIGLIVALLILSGIVLVVLKKRNG